MVISWQSIVTRLFTCLSAICIAGISGCEKNAGTTAQNHQQLQSPAPVIKAEPGSETPKTQFTIGNRSYLFDISNHSFEELESLLQRAQEISQFDKKNYYDLEIVMILHGPDIDWFTRKNQEKNRRLIDLAAKLDAFDIIDMKVCETSMIRRGVKREDIPAFIETVPYAPDEMKKLTAEGYINL